MVDPLELRNVFDRAASLPPRDRATFLARACEGNDGLRREVERLLAADARLGSAFDTEPGSDPATGSVAAGAMSLHPGTRLGPYEIVAALGAGGMGEVYKARDPRLDRTVAIKVLLHDLTADFSARQRFDREARAVAALSHPHICALFDIGHQHEIDFLVMEFLDGETLASRLRRGKLPLDETLAHATHIADALVAAHRAGIVHRDLKPANVMLTAGGIKLLDFGLAKRQHQPVASDITDPTGEPLTHTGMILGTVQYMAPEQLEGRPVDERTDIFAFGVVLYEMLTGRTAFDGSSSAAIIGNILHSEPPKPSSIDRLTPASLDELVRRCVAKDPQKRWQSIVNVQNRLVATRDELTPRQRRRRTLIAIAATILLLMAVAAVVGWWGRTPRSAATTARPDAAAPVHHDLTRLTFDEGLQTDPMFSPDGHFIAYTSDRSGNFDIWVQQMSGGDPVQVTKSPAADTQPSWSPDGTTLAFRSEREGGGIYLVPALGGPERKISDRGVYPSWSVDGTEVQYHTTVFGNSSLAMRAVAVRTGATREVFAAFTRTGWWQWIDARSDGSVSFLGNGRRFFTVSNSGVVESDLTALRTSLPNMFGGQSSIFAGTRFQWNRQGTALLLQTRSADGLRNVWKVQVDPTSLAWTGAERLTTGSGSYLAATFSPDGGRVALSIQEESDRLWEYALTATGLKSGRPLTGVGASVLGADASRDGATMLFQLVRPGGTPPKFWAIRNGQAAAEVAGAGGAWGRLSPDGSSFAYLKLRSESAGFEGALTIHAFDGTDRQIGPWARFFRTPSDWSADGRTILTGGDALKAWPVDASPASDHSRVVLSPVEGNLWEASYSPNGRWLTFNNSQIPSAPHRSIVGVATAEGAAKRSWVAITANRDWADKPRWSEDGRILYFLANEGMFLDVWQIQFDPARGEPVGTAVRLTQFDSPSFKVSPSMSTTGWAVGGRKVYLTMTSTSGSIWTLDNVNQ